MQCWPRAAHAIWFERDGHDEVCSWSRRRTHIRTGRLTRSIDTQEIFPRASLSNAAIPSLS
jgi:hypothetical protein